MEIDEKIWNPVMEKELLDLWEKEGLYSFDPNSRKKVFVIDTPPPYPSGRPWHIGAAAHYSQIDMIARTARMMGFEVYFPIGIDRNGLPVEIYTEKKHGISMHSVGREKFLELCKTSLDDLEAEMISIMKSMGMSGDFSNYYRTDSAEYRALTQSTFIDLWKRGLIYEDNRPNAFCTGCRTTIAEADINYKEMETDLNYVRFSVKETGEEMVIATTRPELICSCQLVIFNPEDERYRKLEGKHAVLPIYGREVEIRPHPSAKPEFGTGLVMICSYGDLGDIRIFREMRLKEIIAITPDGKMSKNAGPYEGLCVKDARKKIMEDLEKKGLLTKKERIVHRTPVCERSKDPVEFIPMKDFYLKQLDFLSQMKKLQAEIEFFPESHRQILISWMDGITIDWPISRRRFYGTEIPIWWCKKCGEANLPEKGKYYQPWKDPPPFSKCKKCGCSEFIGEEKTFDTWMDSSITPLFISRYSKDIEFFDITYPTTIRPQAKDIIRTWLYYTLLRCYQLTEKVPWEKAWIMGYGLDEKGEKMSKSKGNVIDPIPILEKYGADAFRFWAASEASLGSDFRCSEEKISSATKFLTKLWNIARFISAFQEPAEFDTEMLQPTDKWIISELENLKKECAEGYKQFNFFIPANRIKDFIWNVFAPHYIEMVKKRAYGEGFSIDEKNSAIYTLHLVLRETLALLAPIIPFETDFIFRKLYKGSVHEAGFPETRCFERIDRSKIMEFNEYVWKEKKKRGLSLRSGIKIQIPGELKPFEKDMAAMHNIEI